MIDLKDFETWIIGALCGGEPSNSLRHHDLGCGWFAYEGQEPGSFNIGDAYGEPTAWFTQRSWRGRLGPPKCQRLLAVESKPWIAHRRAALLPVERAEVELMVEILECKQVRNKFQIAKLRSLERHYGRKFGLARRLLARSESGSNEQDKIELAEWRHCLDSDVPRPNSLWPAVVRLAPFLQIPPIVTLDQAEFGNPGQLAEAIGAVVADLPAKGLPAGFTPMEEMPAPICWQALRQQCTARGAR